MFFDSLFLIWAYIVVIHNNHCKVNKGLSYAYYFKKGKSSWKFSDIISREVEDSIPFQGRSDIIGREQNQSIMLVTYILQLLTHLLHTDIKIFYKIWFYSASRSCSG